MSNPVPLHLNEKVFRRFEKILFRVVTEFPKKVSVDPKPYSEATIVGRLRDAMSSHIQYKWKSAVDPAKLEEIRPKLIVKPDGGMVVIMSRDDGESGESLEPKLVETPLGPATYKVESPTELDLHAFAHLIGRGLITGPIIYTKVDKELIARFDQQATYNVAIKEEGDFYIML